MNEVVVLEEYQNQGQQIEDQLRQSYEQLEELRQTLLSAFPEEERSYRMGKAMTALGTVAISLQQSLGVMGQIEWPTEDRPR